jgi:hypothetical protein
VLKLRATSGPIPGWLAKARVGIDHEGDPVLVIEGEFYCPADCDYNGFVVLDPDLESLQMLREAGYSIPILQ